MKQKGSLQYTKINKLLGSNLEDASMKVLNPTILSSPQAITDGTLWCVDRKTFRDLILAVAIQRREKLEATLASMEVFKGLSQVGATQGGRGVRDG